MPWGVGWGGGDWQGGVGLARVRAVRGFSAKWVGAGARGGVRGGGWRLGRARGAAWEGGVPHIWWEGRSRERRLAGGRKQVGSYPHSPCFRRTGSEFRICASHTSRHPSFWPPPPLHHPHPHKPRSPVRSTWIDTYGGCELLNTPTNPNVPAPPLPNAAPGSTRTATTRCSTPPPAPRPTCTSPPAAGSPRAATW